MLEEQDLTSPETLTETSAETAKTESVDYSEKFKASQAEAIKLRKELDELKKSKETAVIPEDERRIREIVSKLKSEEEIQHKLEDEKLEKDLIDLETVYGKFSKEKLLQIVDRYGIYDEGGSTNWDKAMELYNKLDEVPTAPIKRIPIPTRENSQSVEVETKPEVSNKNFHQLVQEGLNKLGFKE